MLAKQMNNNRSPLKDAIYLDSAGTPVRIFQIGTVIHVLPF
jgi:hypothetical protein